MSEVSFSPRVNSYSTGNKGYLCQNTTVHTKTSNDLERFLEQKCIGVVCETGGDAIRPTVRVWVYVLRV